MLPCQTTSECSLSLKSFPSHQLILPPETQIFTPVQGGVPRSREALLETGLTDLYQAIELAESHHQRSVERLLVILPDKTRTQMAANLLIDVVLKLISTRSATTLSLLYGLGTHPFMETSEIEGLLGSDRYQKLSALGAAIHQQSTKAITNPMAFVTVWQDSASQALLGHKLQDLREPLLMAWATARQRGAQLWLGIFPNLARTAEANLVNLFASLQAAYPNAAKPMLIDCRDANLNARLRSQLAQKNITQIQVQSPMFGPTQRADSTLEVRFLKLQENQTVTLHQGKKYIIEIPEQLFTHDLTFIAGDTRIHPYEGRYGSGGINKMLSVGIASLNEIRRSHSTRILTHPLTCPGEAGSLFVTRIAATATSIRDTLLTRPQTRAMAVPYGFTVIGKSETAIWDLAFGQDESARQDLAATFTQRYTVTIKAPLDVVISDVEPHKATDITAGARALQYVANWHRPDNPLLNNPEQGCVALLFNPCNEAKNNLGIGNDGTKLHMDVLGDFLQQVRPQLSKNLAYAASPQAVKQILTIARQAVLERWQQHLCSNSEVTDWLEELQRLARTGMQQAQQGSVPRDLTKFLSERMDRYGRGPNHVNRAILSIEYQFQKSGDWEALLNALIALSALYQEHEGLGEGGQRTIRLLKLCRTFKTLVLVTNNINVLEYLNWLDPPLTHYLPDAVRSQYHRRGIRASVLGLVPIHLQHTSAEEATRIAISYGRWHKPEVKHLQVGFLTHPLILKKSEG
ncbi:MAG: hypothetical protein F6K42_08780 [Leptolyngbya sp. SIO1D8]|nr:hypothetical protein [Leptolyngbya sp. SIO1D8]